MARVKCTLASLMCKASLDILAWTAASEQVKHIECSIEHSMFILNDPSLSLWLLVGGSRSRVVNLFNKLLEASAISREITFVASPSYHDSWDPKMCVNGSTLSFSRHIHCCDLSLLMFLCTVYRSEPDTSQALL